jgi:hypothetical protein
MVAPPADAQAPMAQSGAHPIAAGTVGTAPAAWPDTGGQQALGGEHGVAASSRSAPALGQAPGTEEREPAVPSKQQAAGGRQTAVERKAEGSNSAPAAAGVHLAAHPENAGAAPDAAGLPLGRTSTGGSAVHAAGGGEAETFSSLDGGGLPGKGVWVHAGSRQAEAGYEAPALGWVGGRAELDAGQVHAVLVPGSASAAEALSSQVAGLNSYLAERHGGVGTVTVASPGNGAMGMDSGQGREAGHSGAGGQNEPSPAQREAGWTGARDAGRDAGMAQPAVVAADGAAPVAALRADGAAVGRHLSVVA